MAVCPTHGGFLILRHSRIPFSFTYYRSHPRSQIRFNDFFNLTQGHATLFIPDSGFRRNDKEKRSLAELGMTKEKATLGAVDGAIVFAV